MLGTSDTESFEPHTNAGTAVKARTSRRLRDLYCYGLLLLTLGFVAAVRFQVRSMPLERDEGEYAYVGQLMLHGVPPYKLASNMKLPGTYAAYAAMMAVFGQTAAGIHVGMILVTSLSAILVFLLGKYLYGPLAGAVAGASYAFLAARPGVMGIDAHATHFVVVTAVAGILLTLYAVDRKTLGLFFAGGFALGLAFLMKQPGILFAIFAGVYLAFQEWKRPLARQLAIRGGVFFAGAVLSYALTCLLLLWAGVFPNFWFWTWDYARAYGSMNGLSQGWHNLKIALPWAVRPFVLWELAAIGLAAPLWSRDARAHGGLITGFFVSSCLAVCPGLYFRPHYFIVLLPVAALGIGISVECAQRKLTRLNWNWLASVPFLYFAVVFVAAVSGQWNTFSHLDPAALSRKIQAGEPYADAVTVADFIKARSVPQDQIGILGSEPEICFYTKLRCASSYLYMYPLMEEQRFAKQMQNDVIRELHDARPRFLVYVDDERSWGWKATLRENRPFFDQAWNFAHRGYELVDQVAAPDLGDSGQLWGARPQFYVFERQE